MTANEIETAAGARTQLRPKLRQPQRFKNCNESKHELEFGNENETTINQHQIV
jgi:hypothetical protein